MICSNQNPSKPYGLYNYQSAVHIMRHTYIMRPISRIIASSSLQPVSSLRPLVPILSSGKSKHSPSSSLPELLKSLIQDILLNPISWERTCRDCIDSARDGCAQRYAILPVGPDNAAMSLLNASKQNSDIAVSLDEKFSIGDHHTQRQAPTNVSLIPSPHTH